MSNLTEIQVGFIAYKDKQGHYCRKTPITRKVENPKLIYDNYIDTWAYLLLDWFRKKMSEVQNDDYLAKVSAETSRRQTKTLCRQAIIQKASR